MHVQPSCCDCPDHKVINGHNYTLQKWAAQKGYPASCIYTPAQAASIVIGGISILFWIGVSAPQLIKNFKTKSAEAVSVLFLLQWAL
eukprot:gene6260-2545_t